MADSIEDLKKSVILAESKKEDDKDGKDHLK